VTRSGNRLAKLAGTWTDEEFAQFQEAVAPFERVDEEVWG
jgi:hypothetical protein